MYDTLLKSADEMDVVSLNELLESHGILTNVKKYVCGKCNTTFPTKRGRDTHERQCTGEQKEKKKGIQCKYCEQCTPTQKGMITHCSKVHKNEINDQQTI
jgi:DNA-directed RNA polymerase subunit RPC12/RpoP